MLLDMLFWWRLMVIGMDGCRALEEKRARLGLVECVNHDLLQPYPVLHEKPGQSEANPKPGSFEF
jgi:hypothetical protein